MSQEQHSLDGNAIRAGSLAVAGAMHARIGSDPRNLAVLEHGLFFAALGQEIVVVPHDRVHGDAPRPLELAQAAGMPAVKFTAGGLIGGERPFLS